jgi:hypothetical protein
MISILDKVDTSEELVCLPIQNQTEINSISLIDDYRHRPEILENISIYEFAAKYAKIKIKNKQSKYLDFIKSHPQFERSQLKILNEELVPFILGPTIPRKNNLEYSELYSKSILLLFKPWRQILGLCQENNEYKSQLDNFIKNLEFSNNNKILQYIENVELLKKSIDDATEIKRDVNKRKQFFDENPHLINLKKNDDNDDLLTYDEMELDQYLVDNELNKINDRLKEWLNKRENVVKSYFKIENTDETLFNTRSYEHIESLIDTQYSNDLNIWNDQLKNYRVKGYPNIDKEIDNNDKTTKTIQNIEPLFSHYDVILKQINLNSMQKIIFNIFTNTYFDKKACQVILFCTGNGGTGKSEVAKAIEIFFKHYNIAHKLSLSSSTSVSANLLSEASNYVFIIENFIKAVYLKAFLGRNDRSPGDNRLLISDFT